MDLWRVQEFFGNDVTRAIELIRSFQRINIKLMETLEHQIRNSQYVEAMETAHAIKGSSWSIGMNAMGSASQTIELALKQGKFDQAGITLHILQLAFDYVDVALKNFEQNGYDPLHLNRPDQTASRDQLNPNTQLLGGTIYLPLDAGIVSTFFGNDLEKAVLLLRSSLRSVHRGVDEILQGLPRNCASIEKKCVDLEQTCSTVGFTELGQVANRLRDEFALGTGIMPIKTFQILLRGLPRAEVALNVFARGEWQNGHRE